MIEAELKKLVEQAYVAFAITPPSNAGVCTFCCMQENRAAALVQIAPRYFVVASLECP